MNRVYVCKSYGNFLLLIIVVDVVWFQPLVFSLRNVAPLLTIVVPKLKGNVFVCCRSQHIIWCVNAPVFFVSIFKCFICFIFVPNNILPCPVMIFPFCPNRIGCLTAADDLPQQQSKRGAVLAQIKGIDEHSVKCALFTTTGRKCRSKKRHKSSVHLDNQQAQRAIYLGCARSIFPSPTRLFALCGSSTPIMVFYLSNLW